MNLEKTERDLLIEINNDMHWLKDSYIKHCEEEVSRINIIDKKTDSAHRRIDWLLTSGILCLIVLAISIFLKI